MLAQARIAIVGGGIAGCSVAYHLTRLGEPDVLLLEQHELTSGTTWHAAGLCTQFSRSYNLGSLLRRSVELYRSLGVDFHETGSLRLAATPDHVDDFWHVKGVADQIGVPLEVISPERACELHPLMRPDGVLAAAHLPTDGWVDPATVANALARAAREQGATIQRRTEVASARREGSGWLLETSQGEVRADSIVIAAGQWTRELLRRLGEPPLPIVPFEHQYVLTEPAAGLPARTAELPVLRDPEGSFYVRQDGEGLLVGPFEADARPWALDGVPRGFTNRLLRPDLGRITPNLEAAERRVPVLAETPLTKTICGPDGYTPDGRPLLGPLGPENVWILAGLSFFGIVYSGGAGAYLAEWMLEGQPSDSMWELDVARFGAYASAAGYAVARARDSYGREYAIHFPEEERPVGRPLATDPIYDRLAARGAVFGARSGWERPLWFARPGEEARDVYSFRRPNWFAAVGEECRAVRSTVGVLDQTSFAKYEISGPGAERYLDRLCANRLPQAPGRMCLTQLCTPRGGIECDLTVTLLEPDRFYVVSAAATQDHDRRWLERHLPDDGSVRLEDVTARHGVLTIAGPRSRELLQALTDADVSREAFPFFSMRELAIGMAPVRAFRVSYVGELGYELHHPLEYQRHLYESLLDVGEPLGLVDFGYRALESLRLEKCYRLWGADMSADWTPLEAGLDRFVAFDKDDFVGREALLRQRDEGVARVLSCLLVDADDADAHGFEPVYARDEIAGYVASGGYGHTVGASIALSYLPVDLSAPGTELEVEILGARRRALVARQPLYDPANERLLS